MSVTVDANVLVYASNEAEPAHQPAGELLERLAAGPEIVTHPSVLPRPLGPAEAIANVGALIGLPHIRTPGEGEGFWELYLDTRIDPDRGNDVPDGHLAALMRQYGVGTIYSRDRDFRRFDGIVVVDPIDGKGKA